jgi:DNA-directed RNA polymerase subunit B
MQITRDDLIKHQLNSYNDFINDVMQGIVDEVGVLETRIPNLQIKFGKLSLKKPDAKEMDSTVHQITPQDARIRNMTYAGKLVLEIIAVQDGIERPPINAVIGEFPIMVKSDYCWLNGLERKELAELGEDPMDFGGYFIINGRERVVIILEDLAPNTIITSIDEVAGKDNITVKVFSTRQGFRSRIAVTRKEMRTGETLYVSFPGLPRILSLSVVLRALGLNDDEILELFEDEEKPEMKVNLELCKVPDQEEALKYIGARVAIGQRKEIQVTRAQQVLDLFLLPHVGNEADLRRRKGMFLARMAKRAIEIDLGTREVDDKDHYMNKRLKIAGDMMEELFRTAFGALTKDIKYQTEKNYARRKKIDLRRAVRPEVFTKRVMYSLATGNWPGGRTGISQILDRTNYISVLAHLRRVTSTLSRTHPHFEARDLHGTHWGRFCPCETPEGQNCGLVKNLALSAKITREQDHKPVEEALKEFNSDSGKYVIEVNGKIVGSVDQPNKVTKKIKTLRRQGKLPSDVNVGVFEENKEIHLFTDKGRVQRPVAIVEAGKPLVSKAELEKVKKGELGIDKFVEEGKVEYIDSLEEENAYTAMELAEVTPEHTHLELDPSLIVGIGASIIPYSEYNSSPRITMGAAMSKQSLGYYVTNFVSRNDTRANLLHYAQMPMVSTHGFKISEYEKLPSGQNFVVAIMSYHGYNLEDALIFNRSSVDRGLGVSTFFRTYETEEKRYPGGQKDKIELPGEEIEGFRELEAYRLLDEGGTVDPGTPIGSSDVLVGKTSPPRFLEEIGEFGLLGDKRRESSMCVRPRESGTVDQVVMSVLDNGNRLVKIRVRKPRYPELGDKFASRHGQKGVVGLMVRHEDMPFTERGVVPDLIINPHAIPSRMTVGHLLEMIGGKVGAMEGRRIDGTVFKGEKEVDLRASLKKLGFRDSGTEVMYDGKTGKKFDCEIYITPIYYQKLHHMVAGKMHARSRGPVTLLTHQPTEGRANEGGLRFGEMERDCLIGHGASLLLRERLVEESDRSDLIVCPECGEEAVRDSASGKYGCPVCGEVSPVLVQVPHAFKLLLDEIKSMCVSTLIMTEDKKK